MNKTEFLNEIYKEHGGELSLPGVGKLKVKQAAARPGRNPKTGETLTIPAHKKVVFTACKELKEAMKP